MLGQVISTKIKDGTIKDCDVNAVAAIAMSKLNLAVANAQIAADAAIAISKLATREEGFCKVDCCTSSLQVPWTTETIIDFGHRTIDVGDEFDHVTNHRFVASRAGLYLVLGQVWWLTVEANVKYELRIRRSAGQNVISSETFGTTCHHTQQVFGLISLAEGAWLQLRAYHTNQDTARILGNVQETFLIVLRVV